MRTSVSLASADASSSEEGITIPLGTEKETGVIGSEIWHNEYIIYDVIQVRPIPLRALSRSPPTKVNVRYLVKVKFHFK